MKYTQNERILHVTNDTLVVGVDIASETQYARAFDYRSIEVVKVFRFSNDCNGFEEYTDWVENLSARYGVLS